MIGSGHFYVQVFVIDDGSGDTSALASSRKAMDFSLAAHQRGIARELIRIEVTVTMRTFPLWCRGNEGQRLSIDLLVGTLLIRRSQQL